MRKKNDAWIYRIILLLMVLGSLIALAINGIPRSSDKRIQAFDLTEGKTDEDGVYFKVENQVYQYKPEEDLLIELSGSEKASVINYMRKMKEKYASNQDWNAFCKKFWGKEYSVTNVICYEDFSLLTVSKTIKKGDSVETEDWFYKAYDVEEEPVLLTDIVNAPSEAIARFEDKLYYVTDEMSRSNKFVCCDIETGEVIQLKGYHHNYGMVELIVKEDCLYYTTSPYSYVDGGLMYFDFETGESRLIYSNVK